MDTPGAIILVLLAILVPVGFLAEKDEESRETTPFATIVERVEKIRGLEFKQVPVPERVDGAQARRDGLKGYDEAYPVAQRRADETLYKLLGLLPEDADLKTISGSIFGEGVAGYYDLRSKELKIVEGAGTANQVLDEMVVAHEVNHALEDSAIGLEEPAQRDDRAYASLALTEGTATAVMLEYVGRHFDSGVALGGLVGGSFAGTGTEGLPPFVVAGLTFPYTGGQEFVNELYRRAGDRWTLVDLAARKRPPTTTEQILHPDKWLVNEQPGPVTAPAAPGPGWRRMTQGVFGEWQTNQLIRNREAAAGWNGDGYALYARGAERRLLMRWRFDTPKDVGEFVPALRRATADLPGARVARAGGEVSLVVSRA